MPPPEKSERREQKRKRPPMKVTGRGLLTDRPNIEKRKTKERRARRVR